MNYRTVLDVIEKAKECDIVVRIKDEEKNLHRFYNSLKIQKNINFNIIILDSGSRDKSIDIVRLWDNTSLFLVDEENFNFGESLNFLFSKCKSKYIFSFSAHVYFDDEYLLYDIIKYLNGSNCVAGYIRQCPNIYTGCSCVEKAFLRRNFKKSHTPEIFKKSTKKIYFSNAASIYDRKFWQKNKFDSIHGSEDQVWAKRVLDRENIIVYFGNKHVYHSHNEEPSKFYERLLLNYRQQFSFSKIKKNPYYVFIKYFLGIIYYEGIGEIYTAYNYAIVALKASKDCLSKDGKNREF